ncbi:MAG: formylglycine-generating enzyme family protein [Anaerolineae bacterium]
MHRSIRYLGFTVGLLLLFLVVHNVHFGAARGMSFSSVATAVDEVYVPAGAFGMGCAQDYTGIHCDGDASPIHLVYLDAFYIDKVQVTNAQYAACEAAGVCPHPLSDASVTRPDYYTNPKYASYPVINVRWSYANAYCTWVRKRLPTEAEWEKAARGTDLRPFPWGYEQPTCERTNTAILRPGDVLPDPCVGDTVAVGMYPQNASPYGVLDMVGNVREFVNDFYQKYYYATSPYYNPTGPEEDLGKYHLARGGGWYDHLVLSTNWVRHDEASAEVFEHIGFRCARSTTDTPMPTPIPRPTPVPSDSGYFGEEGGMLWITYPEHLTEVHVPPGTLTETLTLELALSVTYAESQSVGTLAGMDHFFIVEGVQPTKPVELLLGFSNSGSVIAGTARLYRLDAGTWVTDGITITERSARHILAWIDRPGLYGILGQTNRTYLPLVVRY